MVFIFYFISVNGYFISSNENVFMALGNDNNPGPITVLKQWRQKSN